MGRTVCTEPQCLYSTAIPLLPLWAVRSVQSLSACTVQLYLYSPYGPYGLYRPSVPVQRCTLPLPYQYDQVAKPKRRYLDYINCVHRNSRTLGSAATSTLEPNKRKMFIGAPLNRYINNRRVKLRGAAPTSISSYTKHKKKARQ